MYYSQQILLLWKIFLPSRIGSIRRSSVSASIGYASEITYYNSRLYYNIFLYHNFCFRQIGENLWKHYKKCSKIPVFRRKNTFLTWNFAFLTNNFNLVRRFIYSVKTSWQLEIFIIIGYNIIMNPDSPSGFADGLRWIHIILYAV